MATQATQTAYQIRPGASNVIRVSVPAETLFNLEKVQQIQKSILGRVGCPGCCSGYHFLFVPELNFAVDEKLNIRPVVGGSEEL